MIKQIIGKIQKKNQNRRNMKRFTLKYQYQNKKRDSKIDRYKDRQ